MEISVAKTHLIKIAGLLGLLQGISWTILSLIAIAFYYTKPDLDTTPPLHYARYIELLLYYSFLYNDESARSNVFVIRPYEFNIFMWIYLFLHVIWIVVSATQICVFRHNKKHMAMILLSWGSIVLVISIIDLIFVSLLGRDFSKCEIADCWLAEGIVMTLAARGFTLWIINIIFVFIMRHIGAEITLKERTSQSTSFPTHSIPRIPQPDYLNPAMAPNPIPTNNNNYQASSFPRSQQQQILPYRNQNYY